jgi:hypothetical protein
MENVKKTLIPEYLDSLETLVRGQIMEIIKVRNHNYNFKSGNNWFNLKSEKTLGTDFIDGPCIILSGGKTIEEIEQLSIKQPTNDRIRVNKIFEKLEEVYIMFLSVSNENSKINTRNLIEFIDKYDVVEKFSSNLFVLTKGQTKYCFIKSENFTNGHYTVEVTIKEISGNEEKTISRITDDYDVKTIIHFLEFVYYSIRTNDVSKIKSLNDII